LTLQAAWNSLIARNKPHRTHAEMPLVSIASTSSFPLPSSAGGESEPEVSLNLLRRFTVEEYHALIEAGFFAEDENYELLEGWLVHKMTKNPAHWITTGLIRDALLALRITCFFVHSRDPVTTTDSEPEPDLALIRGERRDYLSGNPDPKQAPLVVEVADTSLRQDRTLKKRIYARAAIPVYWIVDLIDRQVELYTEPTGPGKKPDYKTRQIIGEAGELPVIIDGRELGRLKVKDLLP
jgi:Uma2 family endonuclease